MHAIKMGRYWFLEAMIHRGCLQLVTGVLFTDLTVFDLTVLIILKRLHIDGTNARRAHH